MSPSPYTEDNLVQQTTADYLERAARLEFGLCLQHRNLRTGGDTRSGE